MNNRSVTDRELVPDLDRLLSNAPAWLTETAFEVEAGRISLDQARERMRQHGIPVMDAIYGPIPRSRHKSRKAANTAKPIGLASALDPLGAWRTLQPDVRKRIGATAIAVAVSNLGANIAVELADLASHRHYSAAESEALSLLFELVTINVLDGDDTNLPPRPDLRPLGILQCRACGCTEDFACDGGCEWVEPDLCSACLAE